MLAGGECTGKSSIITSLTECYEQISWSEFSESFAEQIRPRLIESSDLETIVEGQVSSMISAYQSALQAQKHLVWGDTDLLSSWVYYNFLYGKPPLFLDSYVHAFKADHYFLLSPKHISFVPNWSRKQAGDPEEMFSRFSKALNLFNCSYEVVDEPSLEERISRVWDSAQHFCV